MQRFPFKEGPDARVFVCRHLLQQSAGLKKVYHFSTPEYQWNFVCDAETHVNEDLLESTLGEVLQLFPEAAEVADCPDNVMMVKGESGWYEFRFKGR